MMPLFVVTIQATRPTDYGMESRTHTVWQRARNGDEAIRVALHKLGPPGDEWTLCPNPSVMPIPLAIAQQWVAEEAGAWPD